MKPPQWHNHPDPRTAGIYGAELEPGDMVQPGDLFPVAYRWKAYSLFVGKLLHSCDIKTIRPTAPPEEDAR